MPSLNTFRLHHGYIVHLFNDICHNIYVFPYQNQSYFLPVKQNITCAYVGLNQPISTNNITTSTHQSMMSMINEYHYDMPTFQHSNQNPSNVLPVYSVSLRNMSQYRS